MVRRMLAYESADVRQETQLWVVGKAQSAPPLLSESANPRVARPGGGRFARQTGFFGNPCHERTRAHAGIRIRHYRAALADWTHMRGAPQTDLKVVGSRLSCTFKLTTFVCDVEQGESNPR